MFFFLSSEHPFNLDTKLLFWKNYEIQGVFMLVHKKITTIITLPPHALLSVIFTPVCIPLNSCSLLPRGCHQEKLYLGSFFTLGHKANALLHTTGIWPFCPALSHGG
jgi:hypothetical protein